MLSWNSGGTLENQLFLSHQSNVEDQKHPKNQDLETQKKLMESKFPYIVQFYQRNSIQKLDNASVC